MATGLATWWDSDPPDNGLADRASWCLTRTTARGLLTW